MLITITLNNLYLPTDCSSSTLELLDEHGMGQPRKYNAKLCAAHNITIIYSD